MNRFVVSTKQFRAEWLIDVGSEIRSFFMMNKPSKSKICIEAAEEKNLESVAASDHTGCGARPAQDEPVTPRRTSRRISRLAVLLHGLQFVRKCFFYFLRRSFSSGNVLQTNGYLRRVDVAFPD